MRFFLGKHFFEFEAEEFPEASVQVFSPNWGIDIILRGEMRKGTALNKGYLLSRGQGALVIKDKNLL